MIEDHGKELMMLGGTIAGFIAALLTVFERLLNIQQRLKLQREKKPLPQLERRPVTTTPPSGFFSLKPLSGASYLIVYEVGVIVAAGVLLNYIGLTLSLVRVAIAQNISIARAD